MLFLGVHTYDRFYCTWRAPMDRNAAVTLPSGCTLLIIAGKLCLCMTACAIECVPILGRTLRHTEIFREESAETVCVVSALLTFNL